jgi:hypothetical protein
MFAVRMSVPRHKQPHFCRYGDLIPRKLVDATIHKVAAEDPIGISIGGGSDSGDPTKQFIFVVKIAPTVEANIRRGDIIVQIDGRCDVTPSASVT